MTVAAMSVSYGTGRRTELRNEVSSMPIGELPELQNAVLDRFGLRPDLLEAGVRGVEQRLEADRAKAR